MRATKRLLFTFVITVLWCDLNPALAQQYGWKVIARPTSRNLNTVEFIDSLRGWCAGDDGNIYRTFDGGFTWEGSTRPSNPMITDLSFSDPLHGWAVGNFAGSAGLIWRTVSGGSTWIEQVPYDPRFVLRHWSTSAQNLTNNNTVGTRFASPDTGIHRMTTNGGASWRRRKLADSLEQFAKVEFVDPLHGWITTGFTLSGKFAILRTTDGGNTWQIFTTQVAFGAISFIDTVRGWAVNTNAPTHAYRTVDGGNTWKQLGHIFDPIWDDLHPTALAFVDSLNGWAFGSMFYRGISAEAIYHTIDGGLNWIQESVGLTGDLAWVTDAKMLDRFHGWAVCRYGSVLRYQFITAVAEKLPQLPQHFDLCQNYPNPFNATTAIEYEVRRREVVDITVYDALGKIVRQLINDVHEPGVYRLRFEGSNLTSGEYHYLMKAGTFTATKSMLLLK